MKLGFTLGLMIFFLLSEAALFVAACIDIVPQRKMGQFCQARPWFA